ncbi:MAG: hypothetical protein AMJ43_03595 [Coxiella sp. DG_40]|nr:MAG: hypothetical protein AMJ43_03595 [Coxiella sp. DG_40]
MSNPSIAIVSKTENFRVLSVKDSNFHEKSPEIPVIGYAKEFFVEFNSGDLIYVDYYDNGAIILGLV